MKYIVQGQREKTWNDLHKPFKTFREARNFYNDIKYAMYSAGWNIRVIGIDKNDEIVEY
jgi:hypothetical protein